VRYLYIIGTIFFTVYGQLVIKWQMGMVAPLPFKLFDKFIFLLSMFLNLWIISAFVAAFFASLCWMAAMTKFDLSYAYPFMSLSFVLVLIFSATLFNEPVNLPKIIGIICIVGGIIISAQG
jgi:drug/metabolite transporter (DMT)-like permease